VHEDQSVALGVLLDMDEVAARLLENVGSAASSLMSISGG
jgi:hypothetical protein